MRGERMSAAEENRRIAQHFTELFYAEKNPYRAVELYVDPDYIEHNQHAAPDSTGSGSERLLNYGRGLHQTKPHVQFDVRRIIADEHTVVVHGTYLIDGPTGEAVAVASLYRLADGKLAEHWEVHETIDPLSRNPLPMV
ncbi:nuclear transport factor 2 family protein [Nocardia sp. NBC_00511]|uniref:nuclear transport factor 2 family protein n=1 Tax=Nocardia sp. NBC_00511 TaxID=2903591 RepID=UPI0030E09C97